MESGTQRLGAAEKSGWSPQLLAALAVFFLVIVAATLIAFCFDMPMALPSRDDLLRWVQAKIELAQAYGLLGAAIVIGAYALGVVFAAPSALMTLAATIVYGYWAIAITFLGALLGLVLAFGAARLLFGSQMAWFCARYPVTRGIENALAQNGFWLIFLMRQSPIIPFAAQNYMFGVLNVPFARYAGASALGIIPGTIAKVYIFQTARAAAIDPASSTATYIAGAIGILATIFVMWLIGKAVANELKAVRHAN